MEINNQSVLSLSGSTGKIYNLRQQFLPPPSAWGLTKVKEVGLKNMQAVIGSDQLIMHEYMEVYYKIHSFSFYGPRMLEREHWRQSKKKNLESNVLKKLLSKNDNGWFA